MNPPVILGVDPGAKGAIAALDNATGQLLWVEDMPAIDGITSGALIADLLTNEIVTTAWVERVHSMPKQGIASAFKFGQGFGTILGVLAGARIPFELINSEGWKKTQGLLRQPKSASRRSAIERFPDHSALFARVKDDGRAEAALIARHGWLDLRTVSP